MDLDLINFDKLEVEEQAKILQGNQLNQLMLDEDYCLKLIETLSNYSFGIICGMFNDKTLSKFLHGKCLISLLLQNNYKLDQLLQIVRYIDGNMAEKDALINYIFQKRSLNLTNLSYSSAIEILDYLVSKSLADILDNYIFKLNFSIIDQIILFKDLEKRNINYDYTSFMENLLFYKNGAMNYYKDNNKLTSILKKLGVSKYQLLLKRNPYITPYVVNDPSFINLIASIKDPLQYRSVIYNLENIVDVYEIENLREKISLTTINNLTTNDELLSNYIIDYMFRDFYQNVAINIRQMFLYNSLNPVLSRESIEFYKNIALFNTWSFQEKKHFFMKFKNINIWELYYDDLRMMKNISYKDIVNSSIKLNEHPELLNRELSKKLNIPVYVLDGQNFFALVRCHNVSREFSSLDNSYLNMCLFNDTYDAYSFSYIGDGNILTYMDPHTVVTMLYSDIDYRNIVHLYHSDSYSAYDPTNNIAASKRTNELHTPQSLISNTDCYNEIVIKNNHNLNPTALICYDRITEFDTLLAKKLKLPILEINSSVYGRNLFGIDSYNDETYCEDYHKL